MNTALFAGGCFWGMQDLFRKLPGVTHTRVGYTGGSTANPGYDSVKTGTTGHAETLEITYDPAQISYRDLLVFLFKIHDPTTPNRQGNDKGNQYRSAVFYQDASQKDETEAFITAVNASKKWSGTIVTEVKKADVFYPAEAYHQDYLEHHPGGYSCHFVRPNWEMS